MRSAVQDGRMSDATHGHLHVQTPPLPVSLKRFTYAVIGH
jgi:hypothetical protein